MSDVIRVEWNYAAGGELLKSPEVQAELLRRAELIAAAAGEGMVAVSSVGRSRARAGVYTRTPEAMENEAVHKVLTRAFDAGRG